LKRLVFAILVALIGLTALLHIGQTKVQSTIFHIGVFETCYPCYETDYPEMMENLLKHPDLPAGWEITYERLLTLDRLNETFDVLIIWGHDPYQFSNAEKETLENWIEAGGLIWMDDCAGLELNNMPFGMEIDFAHWAYWGVCYGEYYDIRLPDHPLMNIIYTITEADIRTDVEKQVWFTPFYDWDPKYQILLWGHDLKFGYEGPAILVAEYGQGRIVATTIDITCGLEAVKYGTWPRPIFDFRFTYNLLAWSKVVPKIAATIDIDPDTLNLRSKGRWITCYIEFPVGYYVGDINRTTILLNDTIPVDQFWIDKPLQSVIGDYDNDSIPDLMVKFDRQAVIQLILENYVFTDRFGNVTLTVTGKLYDGTPFQGSDIIRIILYIPSRMDTYIVPA